MALNVTNIILLLTGFQGLLFALVLATGKGPKKLSNRILAAFLAVLAAQMAFLLAENTAGDLGSAAGIMCVFGFAYGPLMYWYTLSLIYRDFQFQPRFLLHFLIPASLMIAALTGYPLCFRIGSLLYISLFVYVFLAVRAIVAYRKVMPDNWSAGAQTDLQWLQWTMIIFCCALLADIVDRFLFDMDFLFGVSIVHLVLLFLVNRMFIKGLRQPQIFLGINRSDLPSAGAPGGMQDSSDEAVTQELDRIRQFMEQVRPYADPDISLNELAARLEMPARRLSWLINHHFGQNFMGFINHYRIEMARERLVRPKDPGETIIEVMYEVGFNSKSSFNTLFKQKTGMTPSRYRQVFGK